MAKAAIFYHGFLTDTNDFGVLYEKLEDRYDHLEKVLFPGHGEGNSYSDFNVDSTLQCVLDKFDELKDKYEIIDVFGFSMGGALSTYLSSQRAFRNMVLFAPANKYLNFFMPFEMAKFYLSRIKEGIKQNSGKWVEETEKLISVYRENDKLSWDMAFGKMLPNYNVHTLETFMHIIHKCNEHLMQINNPTLILWGKLDQLVPKDSGEHLYSLCSNPNSHFDIVPDVSHLMLMSANNQWLIDKTLAFLESNDTAKKYVNFGK